VRRFRHNDLEHAERLLRGASRSPRVLCLDGVNSMTGNAPDLPAFAALAREHDALLYVDDAHGFGVLGERSGYDPSPFGRRGNAIVRFFGESYDRVVLTAGFSKAYSSLLPSWPAPASSGATSSRWCRPTSTRAGPSGGAGHGPAGPGGQPAPGRRPARLLWHRTRALLEHLDKLGVATSNTSGFPRNETGFRIQLTTANTAEQVDHLLTVLEELHDRFGFRRPTPEAVAPLPTAFAPLTRLSNTSSIS
jgi:8-amino-7-oxononanoate synthase